MFYLWSSRPTEGGMNLIRALKGKRIRINRNRPFLARRGRTVINWGSTDWKVEPRMGLVLNPPHDLQPIVDKRSFFAHMDKMEVGAYCVPYTTSQDEARKWIKEGAMVVARTVLNGHSGAGIVIAGGKNELPPAPLYTKYTPKDEEWRIHYVSCEKGIFPIYIQKKVKRGDFAGKHNRYIRNYGNGYTYQHTGVHPSDAVLDAGSAVFGASGLDFGAVDILYVRGTNHAYVLEINTAPGLEGHSVEVYAEAFRKYF